ncbi:MAG: hypothetical protein ACREOO_01120 [bacterium]
MNEPVLEVESRVAREEELFYLKLAREEFAASLGRIEDTARYLIGAIGAVAGLVLAGWQVKLAVKPELAGSLLTQPFLLWGASAFFAILVFFPLPYRHTQRSAQAIRRKFEIARRVKWTLLLLAALAFGTGLLLAANQF